MIRDGTRPGQSLRPSAASTWDAVFPGEVRGWLDRPTACRDIPTARLPRHRNPGLDLHHGRYGCPAMVNSISTQRGVTIRLPDHAYLTAALRSANGGHGHGTQAPTHRGRVANHLRPNWSAMRRWLGDSQPRSRFRRWWLTWWWPTWWWLRFGVGDYCNWWTDYRIRDPGNRCGSAHYGTEQPSASSRRNHVPAVQPAPGVAVTPVGLDSAAGLAARSLVAACPARMAVLDTNLSRDT